MESDAFHLTKAIDPSGTLVIAAAGYLDEPGGIELSREANAAFLTGRKQLCIDLERVVLFNCAGARHLVAVLDQLRDRDERVELVGVRPPLQQLIDFAA